MGASSKKNALAQKNNGPQGSDEPGSGTAKCKLAKEKPPKAQTVTPKITIVDPSRLFFGKVAPNRDEVGVITLGAAKSGDKLGYKEPGYLTVDTSCVTFFADKKCRKPIDPKTAPVKFKFGSLESGVKIYYKGSIDGAANLTLTLQPAKDPRITVSPAATGGVQAQQVMNRVTPEISVDRKEVAARSPEPRKEDDEIHHFKPETKPDDSPFVAVTVRYKASLSVDAYNKNGVVTISGAESKLWHDANGQTPLEAPGGSLAVSNAQLKSGYTFYLSGGKAGQVDLALTLEDTTKDLAEVDTAPATLKVDVKVRVSPHLRVEHLVVLRDRELFKEQRKDDSEAGSAAADEALRIHPDATRIELSAVRTGDAPAYTGKAKLVLSPANAKVFEDEACEKLFDLSQKIDYAKLTGAEPLKLYLRGVTAGKFTAELHLGPSDNAQIQVEGPAKGELGCVELKLKLFHYKAADVNQAVDPDVDDVTTYWNELKGLTFEQKEMTDAERVGVGRMLHVQKDDHHARAKLILEHTAGQWPAAAKDYKIVLDAADADKKAKKRSGAMKVFDAEDEGKEVSLPHELTLTAAAAKTPLWVEGAAKCDGWRGIRLSVGIDRPDGGPAKTRKLDADWGAFTVVNIKEVKCDVGNEAGQEKFLDGTKLFINLDANGRLLKSVAGKRKAEVTATLEPALEDVELYFSIVEHADNYKIAKLPDSFKEKKLSKLKHQLKPVDRTDRKKLLTMSAKTDAQGKAKIETLQTPQMGLLKFKVGAYLLQNPQQARYVEEHADLKKKAPTLSADWLEVWRRAFYGVVAMKRWSGPSYLDRFDEAALKGQMAAIGLELERTLAPVEKDYDRALPNVLTWSRAALGGNAPARTQYLCLINGRGDKADLDRNFNLGAPGGKTPSWNLPYVRVRSTTDKAKWLSSCEFKLGTDTVDLATHTTLTQTEDFKFNLAIDCTSLWQDRYNAAYGQAIGGGANAAAAQATARAAADNALATGTIAIKMKEADSSSGVSWEEAVVVCMDSREPSHATQNAKDSATHTFLHEIGHYLGLAGKFLPDSADTLNPNFYSEQPGEVSARGKGGYGVGPHCDGLNDECIMWYMFKMTLAYCDTCNLYLRARALHSPKITARAKL